MIFGRKRYLSRYRYSEVMTIAELFSAGAPSSSNWIRVEPALTTYWRVILTVLLAIVLALQVALLIFNGQTWDNQVMSIAVPLSIALVLLLFVWSYLLVGRRVAAIGYRLEDRELHVSSGLLFQKLVSVPFARMQLVEVTAGPLERALGIARVQLHTASASTNARIPGLSAESAASLRDSLNTFGEQAGL